MKCGASKRIHVDHIFPRSKYRHLELDFSNLQVLCEGCNVEKSNTDFTDYRTDDQIREANRIAKHFFTPEKKKSKNRKFVRRADVLNREIKMLSKKLRQIGKHRYRYDNHFDICVLSLKIVFMDGRRPRTYEPWDIHKMIELFK